MASSADDPCLRSCLCFVRRTSDSVHGDWGNSRASCSTYLERCHDKCKFLHVLAQELVEFEVLKEMHSIHHQRDLMDGQRNLWIGIGGGLEGPVVGTKQHGGLLD